VKTSKKRFETIDEYIATFPRNVQDILEELRQTIQNSAPDAKENNQLSNACFQIKWQFGIFRSVQKSYWILSYFVCY
jgi:uncharacterized protein YdhG (YjbR/CyaY superfamily)